MRKKHPYIRLFRLICLFGYVEQICFTLSHVLYDIIKYYPSRKAIKYCSGGDIFWTNYEAHYKKLWDSLYSYLFYCLCLFLNGLMSNQLSCL